MATGKHGWLSELWQHMPAALGEFPLLTAGEQTKMSWAKPVETPEDAPPIYAESLRALTARAGRFPPCILTPSYAGFLARTTEKLVCLDGGEIAIFEKSGDSLHSTIYALPQIDLVEVGCILLNSWLKIAGTDVCGQPATTTIKFNSVTDYLFMPFLLGWRTARQERGTALLADQQAKFDHLNKDHFKFMNIARRVILPGDRVLAYIMQLEMRAPVAGLLGHMWMRSRTPTHLVMLTDREVIVASEEKQTGWRAQSRYGSIISYIPLRNIAGAAVESTDDGCLQLSFALAGGEQLTVDFAAEQEADVGRLAELLPVRLSPRPATPLI